MFQSTLPRGERQLMYSRWNQRLLFQSTLPRGERHYLKTLYFLCFCFNPRSRAGSDADGTRTFFKFVVFQSTLPRGERPAASCFPLYFLYVSIHAPARGATESNSIPCSDNIVSIHAPARGATAQSCSLYFLYWFQSTLPRGERHSVPSERI